MIRAAILLAVFASSLLSACDGDGCRTVGSRNGCEEGRICDLDYCGPRSDRSNVPLKTACFDECEGPRALCGSDSVCLQLDETPDVFACHPGRIDAANGEITHSCPVD
jgi:hypothetical protein